MSEVVRYKKAPAIELDQLQIFGETLVPYAAPQACGKVAKNV
jgi:hypothetical protein